MGRITPEHESLELVSDDEELAAGTRIRVEERTVGIPGVAGGVTWELAPAGERTKLTEHVWASFPDALLGRLLEWSFVHLLDGVDRRSDHRDRRS